jgi:hypothetical protein
MRKASPLCVLISAYVNPVHAGFPPSDKELHDFLVDKGDIEASYRRAYSFMVALFRQTTRVVRELRAQSARDDDATLAEKFRVYMTEGQTMAKANPNRQKFYEKVIVKAKTVRSHLPTFPPESDFYLKQAPWGRLIHREHRKQSDCIAIEIHVSGIKGGRRRPVSSTQ